VKHSEASIANVLYVYVVHQRIFQVYHNGSTYGLYACYVLLGISRFNTQTLDGVVGAKMTGKDAKKH
jgi:hypothetical protein